MTDATPKFGLWHPMTPCYVFDIDGTLANGEHRLHHIKKTPKDWDAYFGSVLDDEPINHIIDLANRLAQTGVAIVYVSGRSEVCRMQTDLWMEKHDLPQGPLLMRRTGDRKDDNVLKIELLAELRGYGYDPIMAFDDRDRVVAAWRAAGIPCAQVAPGDF